MKISLVAVGKVRSPYIREGCEDYVERIRKLAPIEVREVKAAGIRDRGESIRRESEAIVGALKPAGYETVALTDAGRAMSSDKFAAMLGGIESSGAQGVQFVIGGAWGLGNDIEAMAHRRLSLGPMTMSHELARLVLLEQIYRAQTILRGTPYAK